MRNPRTPRARDWLLGRLQECQLLVRAGIESAYHDRAAARTSENTVAIGGDLLRNRRRLGSVEKAELGAVQPDTFGAVVRGRQSSVVGSTRCWPGGRRDVRQRCYQAA